MQRAPLSQWILQYNKIRPRQLLGLCICGTAYVLIFPWGCLSFSFPDIPGRSLIKATDVV